MHETSIALNILSIAEEYCRKAGFNRIKSIGVRVGSASSVLPEALSLAFDVIKIGTIAGEASLVIDEVPLGGTCRDCNSDFTVGESYVLACPNCGSADFSINSGRELDITEIEVA
jgi:hydrogenase nickel incorporation protein HypA/HybF